MTAEKNFIYDIGIIGAGPAGLTAAIYALRDNKSVILFEKNYEMGGQILNSEKVVNIPGFPSTSGAEFIENLTEQLNKAEKDGDGVFSFVETTVEDVWRANVRDLFIISDKKETYLAKKIIIAAGSEYRLLGVPGEAELVGRGISFCSTCDAPFCKGKKVAVVGGGNSALTEALEIAKFAESVKILQNLPYLTAEQSLCEKIKKEEKISIQFNTTVLDFYTSDNMIGIRTNYSDPAWNNPVFEKYEYFNHVFIAIGMQANNGFAKHITLLAADGYILTPTDDGVFLAGDCAAKRVKQVVTACGDGAQAAVLACRALNEEVRDG